MLDQQLRLLKEWLLQPVVARVARVGLTPNQLTLISFGLGILAGHFCLEGRLHVALVLWWANRVVDGLDGAVARHLRQQTDFGGYLDIICDFIVYTTIPIDLAFHQVTSCTALRARADSCWLKTVDGAWGPLFWLLVALSFLLVRRFPPRAFGLPECNIWGGIQGTYFINAASLFMLGGILEKRNLGARTRGTAMLPLAPGSGWPRVIVPADPSVDLRSQARRRR
jgi:hypothetical protein